LSAAGVAFAVGVAEAVGVGDAEAVGSAEGAGVAAAPAAVQMSFFPDLAHLSLVPALVVVLPTFEHVLPAFGPAASAEAEIIPRRIIEGIKSAKNFFMPEMVPHPSGFYSEWKAKASSWKRFLGTPRSSAASFTVSTRGPGPQI